MSRINITTVKELKKALEPFDDNERIVIQMMDGEYDRVGFIDEISTKENEKDYSRVYCLPDDYKDCIMLICNSHSISSQY